MRRSGRRRRSLGALVNAFGGLYLLLDAGGSDGVLLRRRGKSRLGGCRPGCVIGGPG